MDFKADKARRLFKFLSEVQKLREKPIREISAFQKDGAVFHLADLLEIQQQGTRELSLNAVLSETTSVLPDKDEDTTLVLSVKRPVLTEFPAPSAFLAEWIEPDGRNSAKKPQLSIDVGKAASILSESQKSKLRIEFDRWIKTWDSWAAKAQIGELYEKFFDLEVNVNQRSEEYELVLGLGHLYWKYSEQERVNRPLFVTRLEIERDNLTGNIEIRTVDDSIRFEGESLPPEELLDKHLFAKIRDEASAVNSDFLSPESFEALGNTVAVGLTMNSRYLAEMEINKSKDFPILTWAPSIIMRKRRKLGLAQGFAQISELIEQEERVPAGLAALIDSNDQATYSPESTKGAIYTLDEEIFSPLPLNEQQQRVLERVDNYAQTIVQGPPGTGKTHMAAALLSHLLAQGKRVLVTAEADRALFELRDKLPESIRELAVSVIDSGREEMAQLRVSVDTINRKSDDFDPSDSSRRIKNLEDRIRRLGEFRMDRIRRCSSRSESEFAQIGYQGSELRLADAIERLEEDRALFGWILDLEGEISSAEFPLSEEEVSEWLENLSRFEETDLSSLCDADKRTSSAFPSVASFESAVSQCREDEQVLAGAQAEVDCAEFSVWTALDNGRRTSLVKAAESLLSSSNGIESNRPWAQLIREAEAHDGLQQLEQWCAHLFAQLDALDGIVNSCEQMPRVEVRGSNFGAFVPIAQSLLQFILSGHEIPVRADGSVKIPRFGKPVLKESRSFFENVRVDNFPPTSRDKVFAYLREVEYRHKVGQLTSQWKYCDFALQLPPKEFVGVVRTDIASFEKAIHHRESIAGLEKQLKRSPMDINLQNLPEFLNRVKAFEVFEEAREKSSVSRKNLERFIQLACKAAVGEEQKPWFEAYHNAILKEDPTLYRNALELIEEYASQAEPARRALFLDSQVRNWSQDLAVKVENDRESISWRPRVLRIRQAIEWLKLAKHVESRSQEDIDVLQSQISRYDKEISNVISELAAERAWARAVGRDRIDGGMKRNLVAYTQSVKRLGKGTGRRADATKRDIRRHLNACRSAVPVWIMPIYKVVEQFSIEENMFDVVIIDEASQAGLDAVFLQFLAPRVVVIGDNKQVSPLAVGVSTEPIAQLAAQYLGDFEHRDTWQELRTSLFDIAEAVYGGRITLVEHRRCVPEIIEFSNENVYRPDHVELRPVREIEADRLPPFRVTRTPNATRTAGKGAFNKDEADMLVKRLLECLKDPEYEGKSIGVISLLSTSKQHAYIQNRLLSQVSSREWEERRLKVGTPAEFQGAERDVIFLSMVDSANEGVRSTAKTGEKDIQRYNVAVSRAKDQVWLFHSIGEEDLNNPDDFRLKLLKHAYSVAEAAPEQRHCVPVSDNVLEEPFDSLFEQRVFNEIVARGFYVRPQVESMGYYIDLVVEGRDARVAVECDGDYWHGPAELKRDQARQRALERNGWKFVRIFESDFKIDRERELDRIWETLKDHGVFPWEQSNDSLGEESNVEIVEWNHGPAPEDSHDEEPLGTTQVSNKNDVEISEVANAETVENLSEEVDEVSKHVGSLTSSTSISEQIQSGLIDDPDDLKFVSTENSEEPLPSPLFDRHYFEFSDETVSVYRRDLLQAEDGLLRIIEAEGPIVEELLFQRYVKCSGGLRVARQAKDLLTTAAKELEKDRRIRSKMCTPKDHYQQCVYYMPGQDLFEVRTRGERSLGQIPFFELVALMRKVKEAKPALRDRELIFREVLKLLGLVKLSDHARNILEQAYVEALFGTSYR